MRAAASRVIPMEPAGGGRSSDEDAPLRAPRAPRAPRGPARATGRLVESTQAEDRRLIALVGARPLLYARSTLPVASYYSQVKKLWLEVADLMAWTVPEVRRKWSHIRNSYSRHLRNEIHGVRTGRGRIVSRWYLADDLEFLRQHMATDTRPSSYSMVSLSPFAPSMLEMECAEQEAGAGVAAGGGARGTWYAAPEPPRDDSCGAHSFEPDENSDYFHFFRGIYKDYLELTDRKQREFRRQCLLLLHDLVDGPGQGEVLSDDTERDQKCFVQNLKIISTRGNGMEEEPAGDEGGGG